MPDVGPFWGPAPVPKKRLWKDQLVPPFWIEFAGPKTNGRCMHGGPFQTMEEATAFAARHAGYQKAPFDGWFQITDSEGNPGPIT